MYANFFVKDKIIKIYNNDGPGFLKEQLNSLQYQSIKDITVNIIDCTFEGNQAPIGGAVQLKGNDIHITVHLLTLNLINQRYE